MATYSILGTVGLDFQLLQLRNEILTFWYCRKSSSLVVPKCEGLGAPTCIIYCQRGLSQSQWLCVQIGEELAEGGGADLSGISCQSSDGLRLS